MKRFCAVILVILFAISCVMLSSCNKADGKNDDLSSNTETTIAPSFQIQITKDNASDFAIVFPENSTDLLISAADELSKAFEECGLKMTTNNDCAENGKDVPVSTPEILIGVTNRTESQKYYQMLKANDYVIATEGNRIIILGGSEEATAAAVDKFKCTYLDQCSGTLLLQKGILNSYTGTYPLSDIVLCGKSISQYDIVLPNTATAIERHAAKLIVDNILEACGYKLLVTTEEENSTKAHIKLSRNMQSYLETEYAFSNDGNDFQISANERTLLYAVREFLSSLFGKSGSSADITPELKKNDMTLLAPHLPTSLIGKTPIGLCDQLNNKAVVIDLGTEDPTSNEAIIWEWTPDPIVNGFTGVGFNHQIDELKLRYSEALGRYVIFVTSSSGFMGIAEYPSGQRIWEEIAAGYGPHSIEYLPNGIVACALSGNGNNDKSEVRIYAVNKDGSPSYKYISDVLVGAHAVHWDREFGVLWAMGSYEIIAYEISGTPENPVVTRIEGFGANIGAGGHDFSADPNELGMFWFSTLSVNIFNKYENKVITNYTGKSIITTNAVKCICELPDGRILRTAATNVFKSHNTDTLAVFQKNDSGGYDKTEYVFKDRAFYKARAFLLH